MSFLRLRPLTRTIRAATTTPRAPATTTFLQQQQQLRFATQDYGSGEGNPIAENPQAQGQRGREDLEHPGPPPPKVARARGESSSSSNTSSSSSTSSNSSNTSPSASQSQKGEGKGKAQPKILRDDTPTNKEDQSEDVQRHNREMEGRAERAFERVDDGDGSAAGKQGGEKVEKGFWGGQGGRDREP
ncbi:hypothetical protein DM02DRAFT_660713 [Periconia macrospinosa]|uniref:Uncharacterized protein n=1 Tax=Periconia macrospinosa TaxID=97972 RepID=A0A2V1D9W5_9PLEO|nr:hypothetical protein DM02DRAFT_660713 [Periconia macrospinosa]